MGVPSTHQDIIHRGRADGCLTGYAEAYAEAYAGAYAEGQLEAARRVLMLLGANHFGPPPTKVEAAIEAESDLTRLEQLVLGVRHATSWQDLLSAETRTRLVSHYSRTLERHP